MEETSDNTEFHRHLTNVRGRVKTCMETPLMSFTWRNVGNDLYAAYKVTLFVTCNATF